MEKEFPNEIKDLMRFMRMGHRKHMLLEHYIEKTDSRYHWTTVKKLTLRKFISNCSALKVSYVRFGNESKLIVQLV